VFMMATPSQVDRFVASQDEMLGMATPKNWTRWAMEWFWTSWRQPLSSYPPAFGGEP